MKIKTFQAMTMQDALKAIKAELGPDVVILSTKSLDPGKTRFGLLGRSMVEVTAAVDHHAKPNAHVVRPSIPRAAVPAEPSSLETPLRFRDVLTTSLRGGAATAHTSRGESVPARPDLEPVLQELKHIRESLRGMNQAGKAATDRPDALDRYREELIRGGLDPRTAMSLVKEAADRIPQGHLTEEIVRARLREVMVPRIRTSGPLLQAGDKKKTVILVGPTGVGKTTTLAKLAAHYRLRERRGVALVTLDTYRLAAVEQLRTYATLIGVPMDVALTRGDAMESLARRADTELILIDTAGRSPRDAAGIAELRQLLDLGNPLEIHLVLSATTRERDLIDIMERFRALPITRLLFTKLDETNAFGGLFEVMHRTGLPLSYFTRGQRVPEDLDIATPAGVAELIVGLPTTEAESTSNIRTI